MIKTELELENHKYYYAINQCKNDQADPILFINGAFQCMNSWQKAVDHFKDNTTTIVADLPGWGDADFLSDDYDFDFLARAIFQILEKESINKINIVSTSYGTPIAVSFAKNFPSFFCFSNFFYFILRNTSFILLEIYNSSSSYFNFEPFW